MTGSLRQYQSQVFRLIFTIIAAVPMLELYNILKQKTQAVINHNVVSQLLA